MTPLRIYIADDNEMFQELITLFLRGQKEVEIVGTARNGADALSGVEKYKPDVVFIDLNMPKAGGTKTPQTIKERFPDTGVYICSAYPDDALQASVEQLGVDGYISKATLKLGLTDVIKKERAKKK